MGRERALKALGEFLRPEFLNRVDEIVCFNRLTEENFADIAVLMLGEVKEVMQARAIELTWDQSVIDYLVKKGYSTVYGARNLRRLIQKDVEDVIAARMISERGRKLTAVHLTSDGESISCESVEAEMTSGE